MEIRYEKSDYGMMKHVVYVNNKRIGTLRQFCCGVDFRIDGKPNALFSIMPRMKYDDEKLKECVSAILKLKIPKRNFHWNFRHDIANDLEAMKKYELNLNRPKRELI